MSSASNGGGGGGGNTGGSGRCCVGRSWAYYVAAALAPMMFLAFVIYAPVALRSDLTPGVISLQGANNGTISFMTVVSEAGSVEAYVIIFTVLVTIVSTTSSLVLFYALSLTVIVVDILKMLFGQPRPYWVVLGVEAHDCSVDLAFPSGHTALAFSLTFTGTNLVAAWANRVAARKGSGSISTPHRGVVGALMVLSLTWGVLTILSRMMLGAHSLRDCVAGIFAGCFVWALVTLVEEAYGTSLKRIALEWLSGGIAGPLVVGVASVFAVCLMLLVWLVADALFGDGEYGSDLWNWQETARRKCPLDEGDDEEDAVSLLESAKELVSMVAAITGQLMGYYVQHRLVGYFVHLDPIKWWQRLINLVGTMLVIGGLFVGLGAIPKTSVVVDLIFRTYLRFFLILICAYGLLPVAWVRLWRTPPPDDVDVGANSGGGAGVGAGGAVSASPSGSGETAAGSSSVASSV